MPVIRSSPGSQALAPARTAIVRAVAHESQPLKAAALAYPSRPGAARCRTRIHRDKGNDADLNINLPTLHDKSSYPGTVRSSRRSGRGAMRTVAHITRFGTASGDPTTT